MDDNEKKQFRGAVGGGVLGGAASAATVGAWIGWNWYKGKKKGGDISELPAPKDE